ncbi:hypothetical protein MBLNU230_g1418t1 [Neophaeotheca triangularis]
MLFTAAIAATLLQAAAAVNVDGYISEGCHGERLYSYDIPFFQNCKDISELQQARSMIMADFTAGQTMTVYSDSNCQDQIYTTSTDICFTIPDDNANSFFVSRAIS